MCACTTAGMTSELTAVVPSLPRDGRVRALLIHSPLVHHFHQRGVQLTGMGHVGRVIGGEGVNCTQHCVSHTASARYHVEDDASSGQTRSL